MFAGCLVVLLCVACGRSDDAGTPPGPTSGSASPAVVDVARVGQSRTDVPPGFEFADVAGRVAPVAQWGLGAQWSVDPGACAALVDPRVDPATLRGWSASGPGAIVYAVAAASSAGLDPGVRAGCGRFSVSAGPTTGDASVVDGPVVDGAETVGVRVETATVVEGGTETRSHAETFTAYLPGHVVYVTVVTDPGADDSVLGRDFAARLLTGTAAAVRGTPVGDG